jgi:hypothetical protein
VAGPSIGAKVTADTTPAAKAMDDVAAKGSSAAAKLHSAFGSALSALNQSGVLGPFGEALNGVNEAIGAIAEHGKNIGPAMLGVGTAVAGIGAGLSALGSKDKAAHQQLQASVEATGKSYEDYASSVDGAIKKQEKYGHSAVDTQDALRVMTQAMGNPQAALMHLSEASDLAAAKHESLTTAAGQLGKAYNGSAKLLKEFGVASTGATNPQKALATATAAAQTAADADAKAHQHLADVQALLQGKTHLTTAEQINLRNAQQGVQAADAKLVDAHGKLTAAQAAAAGGANTHGAALDQLAGKLKGQAAAQADTFTGKLDAMKTKLEDSAAQLGQKYGPALTAAGSVMAGFGAAMTAVTTARDLLTAADWASVPAELASMAPILLIVGGLALLALAGYELVKHWKEIWGAIKQAAVDVWDWIKKNWPLLLDILLGPIGFAVGLIITHFDTIKRAAGDAVGFIVGVWNGLFGFFAGIVNKIEGVFSGVEAVLEAPFKAATDFITRIWNDTVGKLKLPSLPGGGVVGGALKAVGLQSGGIVTSPTLALIGEHGPEAVVPLSHGLPASSSGPALVIQNATFNQPADVDMLMAKTQFAVSAGRL